MRADVRHAKITKLIKRDGRACWLCGIPMTRDEMTLDHVVPKSRGGGNEKGNLRLAHAGCNSARGNLVCLDSPSNRAPKARAAAAGRLLAEIGA